MIKTIRTNGLTITLTILFSLSLILSGCSAGVSTKTTAETATQVPTATMAPTLSYTAHQGTPFPTPMSSFDPTDSPSFVKLATWGDGMLYSSAVSPDGSIFALGYASGVHLYNAATLTSLPNLQDGNGAVLSLVFSSDSGRLAAAFSSRINIYDTKTWQLISVIQDIRFSEPQALSFSPDGKTLAAATELRAVGMYDTESGMMRVKAPLEYVDIIGYSPDGSMLITVSDQSVNLVDVYTLQTVFEYSQDKYFARSLISPDGKFVVTFDYEENGGRVRIFDVEARTERTSFTCFDFSGASLDRDSFITDAAINSKTNALVLSYGYEGIVVLWDLVGNEPLKNHLSIRTGEPSLHISKDGQTIFTYGYAGYSRWNAIDQSLEHQAKTNDIVLLVSIDSNKFVTVERDSDAATDNYIANLWGTSTVVTDLALSETVSQAFALDDTRLVISTTSGIQVWDMAAGSLLQQVPTTPVNVSVSTNHSLLAAALVDNSIQVYKLPNLESSFLLTGHTAAISGLFFDDQNNVLVSSSSVETLVWDLSSGEKLCALQSTTSVIGLLPVSQGIITLTTKMHAEQWDPKTGQSYGSTSIGYARFDAFEAISVGDTVHVFYPDGLYELYWGYYPSMSNNKYQWETGTVTKYAISDSGESLALITPDGIEFLNTYGYLDKITNGQFDAISFIPSTNDLVAISGDQAMIIPANESPIASLPESVEYQSYFRPYIFTKASPFLPEQVSASGDLVGFLGRSEYWLETTTGNPVGENEVSYGYQRAVSPDGMLQVEFVMSEYTQDQELFYIDSLIPTPTLEATPTKQELEPIFTIAYDFTYDHNMAVSNNGRLAFESESYSLDSSEIEIWDLATGRNLKTFQFNGWTTDYALSADGNRLAIFSPKSDADAVLSVYDITDPASSTVIAETIPSDVIKEYFYYDTMTFSPDGKWLAIGGDQGRIYLFDSITLEYITTFGSVTNSAIEYIVFYPDNKTLLTLNTDGIIDIWGISEPTGFKLSEWDQPTLTSQPALESKPVSMDELKTLNAADFGIIEDLAVWTICQSQDDFYDCYTSLSSTRLTSAAFSSRQLSISESGNILLLYHLNGVSSFDITSPAMPTPIEWAETTTPTTIAFEPNQQLIAVSYPSTFSIQLQNDEGSLMKELKAHGQDVIFTTFSNDGRFLASATKGQVILWDSLMDWDNTASITMAGTINGLAIVSTTDGNYVLYVTTSLTQQVFDNTYQIKKFTVSSEGEILEETELDYGELQPTMVRSSPNGEMLALRMEADKDSILFLDAKTLKVLGNVQCPPNTQYDGAINIILDMQFLSGSNGLAVTFSDGTLHLFGVSK